MPERQNKTGDMLTEKSNTPSLDDEGLPTPGSSERLLAERKLVRKLDMRLIPTICIIYIMNYVDVSYFVFALDETSCNSCFNSVVVSRLHD